MYNKLSENYKKRHIYNFEDEPPDKKLISDGDVLIKQLAEKQRNTRVDLQKQLTAESHFYKSTEEVSLTNYTSGAKTLEEFNTVLQHSNQIEKLKSYGLSNEEIELFFDYKRGKDCIGDKHKNMNASVLKERWLEILNKIKQSKNEEKGEIVSSDRLKTELTLSSKPTSIETKLLKFALENQMKTCKEKLPSAIDHIKDVEQQLVNDLSPPNIKKIRKKARQLTKHIDAISNPSLKEPVIKDLRLEKQNDFIGNSSKWDLKECQSEITTKESKMYTCKPQNYYTIKNGQIIKLNSSEALKNDTNESFKERLSVEEIKKIPKFEKYEKGSPSKVLYLKNLVNCVTANDLKNIFKKFLESVESVNIMKGKMRGQAFIAFKDEQRAEEALGQCNGIFLKNKPVIIQFGKKK